MKKTFLKTGAFALFLFFGLAQSASAQNVDGSASVQDDLAVVTTTTVTKTFETADDDATVEVQKGKAKYKMYSLASGKGAKWKEMKSGEVSADGSSATGMSKAKKLTLTAKGSQKMRVEVTLDSGASATIKAGKM